MPRKSAAAAAKKKDGELQHGDAPQLLAQEWQTLSDSGAAARAADLDAIEEAVGMMHLGGGGGGLKAALDRVKTLDGPVLQDLMEVSLSLVLVNESEGMDKNKKDALVVAVAKELAGGGGRGGAIRMDTQLPNSDVRVVHAQESSAPSDPRTSEMLVELSIVADSRAEADALLARLKALVEVRGGRQIWTSLPGRLQQEIDAREGAGDRRPVKAGFGSAAPRKEARLVAGPVVRSLATDLVTHSTNDDACVPRRQGMLRLLVLGGRDPYKNDFVRWAAGMEPSEGFQCKKAERPHCFTVVSASQYPHDYRGYKVACRLGDVDRRVQDAMRLSFQQISTTLASAESAHGKLSSEQFAAAFGQVELLTSDGQPVHLTPSQIDDLFSQADVDNDGTISKAEFLRAFKPPKGQLDVTQMELAGALTRKKVMAGHADAADKENEDKIHALQSGIKSVDEELKKEAARAKQREVETKANAQASAMRKKFATLAETANRRIESAKRKLKDQQAVLDNPASEQKEVKKAQQIIADANKDLVEAKKQLEAAQAQHDAAVNTIVKARDLPSDDPDALFNLDTVETVQEKIRLLMMHDTPDAVYKVFEQLDIDGDGRLTTKEFKQGIEQILLDKNVRLRKGLIEQVIAYVDVSGDGFIDFDEFLSEFEGGDQAKSRRNKPGISDLPCLAMYNGGAKVMLFPDGQPLPWEPRRTEDQTACGQLFDARIGKEVGPGKFRVTFVHKREDPLSRDVKERILYALFTGFPEGNTISQVCNVSDIRLHYSLKAKEAMERFAYHRANVLRGDLINIVREEVLKRVSNKGLLPSVEQRLTDALSLGHREKVLNEPDLGMLRIWEEYEDVLPADKSIALEKRKMDMRTTAYSILVRRGVIKDEEDRAAKIMEAWEDTKTSKPILSYVGAELLLAWGHNRQAPRLQMIQAPELFAQNQPRDEGSVDMLETIRFFFPDPASKLPLDKQIRKKFEEMDVDKSGGLDKKEFKTLIKATVNKGQERLSPAEVDNLVDLLDADGSGTIEIDELIDAVIPRGTPCPYDQIAAFQVFAQASDRILVLVDPQHTRFNPWEKSIIKDLHKRHASRIIFASFVTAEHQDALKQPGAIIKAVNSSADEIAEYLSEPSVGRELRENIISVGALIDYTIDRDGTMRTKSSKGNTKWRQLPNALSRFFVRAFSPESRDASDLLQSTERSLRLLSIKHMKAWRALLQSIGTLEDTHRRQLASAANGITEAADLISKRVDDLYKQVKVIEIQNEVQSLKTACKFARKNAKRVLEALGMDALTQKDKEEEEAKIRKHQQEVETAVRQSHILEWKAWEHIQEWMEQISERNSLSLQARTILRAQLQEYGVRSISGLVQMDSSRLKTGQGAGLDEGDAHKIMCEVNRVRSAFWKVGPKDLCRNVWLLVREQFLRMEDLKLFYAIIDKKVAIPDYWRDTVTDGLQLLTIGLLASKPLALISVKTEDAVSGKEIENYYFTDNEVDEANPPHLKRGRVSANTVANLLLELRSDVCSLVGWVDPGQEDSDEEQELAKAKAFMGLA